MASSAVTAHAVGSTNHDMPPESVVFGFTEAMNAVRQKVEKIAAANVPVLICGESGTGKELLARYIHARSPWATGPFVKVSCPAIPATLLESELFGYERGAFTGANNSKPGKVEIATGGILLLDEIGELPWAIQAKMLQILQDGEYCPIGGEKTKLASVRIVCTTNHQLEEKISSGAFREDLFYRINVIRIQLPPLRARREDIARLAEYFVAFYEEKYGRTVRPLSSFALGLLRRYDWPGNIRQLENLVRRYVILGSEDAFVGELQSRPQDGLRFTSVPDIPTDGSVPLKRVTRQAIRQLEREIITRVLQATRGNQKEAARRLEISYRALLYKIRQAGLPRKRAAAQPPMIESPTPEAGLQS